MKHLTKIFLVLAIIVASNTAMAQTNAKIGYVNSAKLLEKIPGREALETELLDYRKGLEDQVQAMVVEYQTKIQDYQENAESMSDLIRQSKEGELRDLEQRIQSFRQTADVDLQNKQGELFNPLLEKAQKAIEKVAEDNGYTYVFDVSMGTLLYYKKGDNLQSLIEKELGITE